MADPRTYRPQPGSIPDQPGVYKFRDEHGTVIYVGKAKSLRSRLANYFADLPTLHPRTQMMVTTASSVEWTVVGSEVEALQLEYTWIKQFDPRFNVKYRDDKSYPMLAVSTGGQVPRAFVYRGPRRKGVRYFGPYSHAWAIRETLDLLTRVFPIRTCSKGVYNRHNHLGRPCLLGYIDKCAAPCVGKVSVSEHREIVANFVSFMSGNTAQVTRDLEKQMMDAAEELDFEKAARLRDDLQAITKVMERQSVVLGEATSTDVIAIRADELEASVQIFHIRGGRIMGQRGWIIESDDNAHELMANFLVQFYSDAANDQQNGIDPGWTASLDDEDFGPEQDTFTDDAPVTDTTTEGVGVPGGTIDDAAVPGAGTEGSDVLGGLSDDAAVANDSADGSGIPGEFSDGVAVANAGADNAAEADNSGAGGVEKHANDGAGSDAALAASHADSGVRGTTVAAVGHADMDEAVVRRGVDKGLDSVAGAGAPGAKSDGRRNNSVVPRDILISTELPEDNQVTEFLSKLRGGPVTIRVPQRGEKRELMDTVMRNAVEALRQHKLKRTGDLTARTEALQDLQENLFLPTAPLRIECVDISHIQGHDVVASLVVFEDGLPKKKDYRKFEIKEAAGDGHSNDVGSIAEVTRRRFSRLLQSEHGDVGVDHGGQANAGQDNGGQNTTAAIGKADATAVQDVSGTHSALEAPPAKPNSFSYPPNLYVVDGGLPQVNAARAVLDELGLEEITVIGLAKRLEEIWIPGEEYPLILSRTSPGLYLLQHIRDESHRVAITYHRSKRSARMKKSELDEIAGLGPAKRKELLKTFSSVKKIREATQEELATAKGIGPQLAEKIYQHFHPEAQAT